MGDLLSSDGEFDQCWELRPRSVDQMGFVVSKMSVRSRRGAQSCNDTSVQIPQGYNHAHSLSH